jgi:hypothetical protein
MQIVSRNIGKTGASGTGPCVTLAMSSKCDVRVPKTYTVAYRLVTYLRGLLT